MKLLSTILFFLVVFLGLFTSRTFAASQNYKTAYDVTYTVDPSGTTHAVMKIGLTNLTSKYYASSYKLQIGFPDVENIKASDSQGQITPILKKNNEGYQVELQFNDRVVGINNTVHFTLTFDTQAIATKHKEVWEITIPSTAEQENFGDFTITVKPPPDFGTPSIVRPQRESKDLVFTKKELGSSGVSLLFGNTQNYAFDLMYHLKNNNVFSISTEIALPMTTGYQDVMIEDIYPKPSNVLIDKDGNWLAQYRLAPSERLDVKVTGRAQLSLKPHQSVLTKEERVLFTREQPYWQQSPEIKKLASELKTPEKIYEYVVKTLRYDFNRHASNKNRIGAKDILLHPDNAVCLEFTDLFIALIRAAGIPSREVDGFAYTTNEVERPLSLIPDVLHAWPEYYDEEQKAWIMVDPTWGNTTGGMDYFHSIDLGHLAFITKGVSSSYPVSAGGYKLPDRQNNKDVSVSFGDPFQTQLQKFTLTTEFDENALSGFPIKGNIIVGNPEKVLSTTQTVHIHSSTLTPHNQDIKVLPIPPFGQRVLGVTFDKLPFLTKGTHTFTMSIQGKLISQSIFVTRFLMTKWHYIGGIIIGILTIGLLIFAYKTRRLPFLRR